MVILMMKHDKNDFIDYEDCDCLSVDDCIFYSNEPEPNGGRDPLMMCHSPRAKEIGWTCGFGDKPYKCKLHRCKKRAEK